MSSLVLAGLRTRFALGWLALVCATAASAAPGETRDAPVLRGSAALPAGAGGLILVVAPVANGTDLASGERWDAYVEQDGGVRWRLADATTPAVHVLPTGRHRFDSIRSASGRQINGIMPTADWIEVRTGGIAYAGRWWIETTMRLDLDRQIRGGVSFPREPIAALDEGPQGPLLRYPFMIARRNEPPQPVGRQKLDGPAASTSDR